MTVVPSIVVAINDADQVIDVSSGDRMLDHVAEHFRRRPNRNDDPRSTSRNVEPSEAHVIQFFDQNGQELQLAVSNSWHALTFRPHGRCLPTNELRARIEGILVRRMEAIEAQSRPPMFGLPSDSEWPDFLSACAALLAGRTVISWPDDDDLNRRGWFHNTFVHGGKP
ncbi:MAG TPA: hypothetical protein VF635_01970 [Propionibacteriaceae bacterium]|jgi:hypothetical protein